jgi:hypothetical protein
LQKAREPEMSKQAMREETERLVKEAMEHKAIAIKRGRTRIESKCAKCGALNRVVGGPRAGSGAVHVQAMRRKKATDVLRRLRPRIIPLSIAVREAVGIELRY